MNAEDAANRPDTYWRRNMLLLILDSMFFMTALSLSDVSILSVFIVKATGSTFLAGLLQMVRVTGFFFPQLLSINIGSVPYKKRVFIKWTAIGRCWLSIAVLGAFFIEEIAFVVLTFFLAFSLFPFFDGFTVVPWLEFVVKSIPQRQRGSFFGLSQGLGAIGMIASGYLVAQILNESALVFPQNYGLLVLIQLLLMMVGLIFLIFLQETADKLIKTSHSLLDRLKSIPKIIQNNTIIQKLILIQVLSSCYSISTPFYSLFAITRLDAPDQLVGYFLMYQMIGRLVASYPWARLGNTGQNKWILQLSGIMILGSLLLALSLGTVFSNIALITPLLFSMFFLYGAGVSGIFLGFNTYIMELADHTTRPILLGTMNALNIVTSILPVLGGIIIESLPYELLFLTSLIPISCSLVLTYKLPSQLG
jgi:MFS family permease